MKCQPKALVALLLLLLCFDLAQMRKHNRSKKSPRHSQSAEFIAHFLKGIGVKIHYRKLARKADKLCPQLRKRRLVVQVVNRINRIKAGIKRLKKEKLKAQGKRRKFLRNLGKAHIAKLIMSLLLSVNKCSLVPIMVSKKINRVVHRIRLILNNKACRGKKCSIFSFRKLNRVYRYFLAHLRHSGSSAVTHRNIAKTLAYIINKYWKVANQSKKKRKIIKKRSKEKKEKVEKKILKQNELKNFFNGDAYPQGEFSHPKNVHPKNEIPPMESESSNHQPQTENMPNRPQQPPNEGMPFGQYQTQMEKMPQREEQPQMGSAPEGEFPQNRGENGSPESQTGTQTMKEGGNKNELSDEEKEFLGQ